MDLEDRETLIWSNEDMTFMMMFRSVPKMNNLGLFFPTGVGWVFEFADDSAGSGFLK